MSKYRKPTKQITRDGGLKTDQKGQFEKINKIEMEFRFWRKLKDKKVRVWLTIGLVVAYFIFPSVLLFGLPNLFRIYIEGIYAGELSLIFVTLLFAFLYIIVGVKLLFAVLRG
jgi:hypothetical protein